MNFNLMVIDFVVFMVFMGASLGNFRGITREFPTPHRNSSEVLANEAFISYFF
jgi:hypothetical protein